MTSMEKHGKLEHGVNLAPTTQDEGRQGLGLRHQVPCYGCCGEGTLGGTEMEHRWGHLSPYLRGQEGAVC